MIFVISYLKKRIWFDVHPKSVIDSWKNVNYLEILFDGGSMVITPYLEG